MPMLSNVKKNDISFNSTYKAWREKVARAFSYFLEESKHLDPKSASVSQAKNFFLRIHSRVSYFFMSVYLN